MGKVKHFEDLSLSNLFYFGNISYYDVQLNCFNDVMTSENLWEPVNGTHGFRSGVKDINLFISFHIYIRYYIPTRDI